MKAYNAKCMAKWGTWPRRKAFDVVLLPQRMHLAPEVCDAQGEDDCLTRRPCQHVLRAVVSDGMSVGWGGMQKTEGESERREEEERQEGQGRGGRGEGGG